MLDRYASSTFSSLDAMERISSPEVTRFKGLGEISPSEFGAFIGENIKLTPVTISSITETRRVMDFCMGENNPQRKEYIMENLI